LSPSADDTGFTRWPLGVGDRPLRSPGRWARTRSSPFRGGHPSDQSPTYDRNRTRAPFGSRRAGNRPRFALRTREGSRNGSLLLLGNDVEGLGQAGWCKRSVPISGNVGLAHRVVCRGRFLGEIEVCPEVERRLRHRDPKAIHQVPTLRHPPPGEAAVQRDQPLPLGVLQVEAGQWQGLDRWVGLDQAEDLSFRSARVSDFRTPEKGIRKELDSFLGFGQHQDPCACESRQ
jgi:hypothetical protein